MAGNDEQKIPVDEKGVMLLKQAFQDNDELLVTVRSLLFGYELNDEELGSVRAAFKGKPELQEQVREKIFQEIRRDRPIGANPDFWIGVEMQIVGQHPDTVTQILRSKDLCLQMLRKGTALLEDPDGEKVDITYNPDGDLMGTKLIARNLYIKSVESGLVYCKIIAAMDPKQLKKNAAKDSMK